MGRRGTGNPSNSNVIIDRVIQGIAIAAISGLLISSSNNGIRISVIEATTMDKIEVIERVNQLEDKMDTRMDTLYHRQTEILRILRSQ
jgi:hypothetical protein